MQEIDVKAMVERFCKEPHLFHNLCGADRYLSEEDLDSLDELPGIYFVAATGGREIENSSEIIYVGMSSNIWSRWRSHHKMKAFFRLNEFIRQQKKLQDKDGCATSNQLTLTPYYLPFTPLPLIKEIEGEFIRQIEPLLNDRTPVGKIEQITAVALPEAVITVEPAKPIEDDYDDYLVFPRPRRANGRRSESVHFDRLDNRLIKVATGYAHGYYTKPSDNMVYLRHLSEYLTIEPSLAKAWANARGIRFPMETEKFIRLGSKLAKHFKEQKAI